MIASTFLASTLLGTQKIRAVVVGVFLALLVVAGSVTYEVRPGDTLSGIAAANGVTLEELLAVNDIADPDLIRVGQQIVVPGEEGPEVHVVQQGDTLGTIASQYGASTNAIAELNEIANVNLIRIGQKLEIPGGAGTIDAPTEYHVVKAGETLATIAAHYGISLEQLATANGITNPSLIYVGTRLALSGSTFVVESTPAPATHTVTAGETITTISRKYGVRVPDIVAANDIANVNLIRIGQVLEIPGAGQSAWVCPVPGARYVNDWGFPRSDSRFHEGNDLFAPRGSKVLAPVGGNLDPVIGKVGGFQFFLYGDDGVTYIGSHLDAFGRSGRVEAGETIGYVGDTGNARGGPTHLHFEMHPNDGKATNPFPTLQEAGC